MACEEAARAQVAAAQGGGRQGHARSRLHRRHLADRRPRRHDAGEGRQPRRPRREHAAHDGVAARPDPVPRRHQRSRVPAASRGGAEELRAARGGQKVPIELVLADGTVHPQKGTLDAVERAVDADDRHADAAVQVPESRRAACGPASTGARASSSSRRRARCSCRSAPCRSCRTCTASRSSAPTTRSPSRPSRWARAWAASGSSRAGSTGNERVVVEGLQRVREGMVVNAEARAPVARGQRPGRAGAAAGER